MAAEIQELIRQAFQAARDKGKADWWRMTTPVLKNRLLAITDRRFDEEDYGANTMVEFAAQQTDILSLDTTAYPPEVELRSSRIRPDLWRAIVDYRSGSRYVWDGAQSKARKATTNFWPDIRRRDEFPAFASSRSPRLSTCYGTVSLRSSSMQPTSLTTAFVHYMRRPTFSTLMRIGSTHEMYCCRSDAS